MFLKCKLQKKSFPWSCWTLLHLRAAHDVLRTSPLHFHDFDRFLLIPDFHDLYHSLPRCLPWFPQDFSGTGTCFAFKRSMISCQGLGDRWVPQLDVAGILDIHVGGSIVMGVPPKWLVYFMENPVTSRMIYDHGYTQNGCFCIEHPHLKWMMTGGTPISGNLHLDPFGLMWLVSGICVNCICCNQHYTLQPAGWFVMGRQFHAFHVEKWWNSSVFLGEQSLDCSKLIWCNTISSPYCWNSPN